MLFFGEVEADGGVGFEHVAAGLAVGAEVDEFDGGVVVEEIIDDGVAEAIGDGFFGVSFIDELIEGIGRGAVVEVVLDDEFGGFVEVFAIEASGGFEVAGEPEAGGDDEAEGGEGDDEVFGGEGFVIWFGHGWGKMGEGGGVVAEKMAAKRPGSGRGVRGRTSAPFFAKAARGARSSLPDRGRGRSLVRRCGGARGAEEGGGEGGEEDEDEDGIPEADFLGGGEAEFEFEGSVF